MKHFCKFEKYRAMHFKGYVWRLYPAGSRRYKLYRRFYCSDCGEEHVSYIGEFSSIKVAEEYIQFGLEYLHFFFENGSNPYLFKGTRSQCKRELAKWSKHWDIEEHLGYCVLRERGVAA